MMCLAPFRLTNNLDRREYPDGLLVPCGKCLPCRIKKRSEWTLRLWHESSYWEKSCFPTLTYSDNYLPENSSLKKLDLQKFFKRVRKHLSDKGEIRPIKYFACGEYGDNTDRPHYHAIIFGIGLDEEDQKLITDCWPYGHVKIGTVTPDSIRYVAQYIDKKYSGEKANEEYQEKNRESVFRILSQGLGKRFAIENVKQITQQKKCTMHGSPMGIPRYYIKKLEIPKELLRDIAQQRQEDICALYTGLNIDPDVLYKIDTPKYKLYHDGVKKTKVQKSKNIQAKIDIKRKKL